MYSRGCSSEAVRRLGRQVDHLLETVFAEQLSTKSCPGCPLGQTVSRLSQDTRYILSLSGWSVIVVEIVEAHLNSRLAQEEGRSGSSR